MKLANRKEKKSAEVNFPQLFSADISAIFHSQKHGACEAFNSIFNPLLSALW